MRVTKESIEEKVKVSDVLYIACNMGKMILRNGGETYRTEETIVRTCAHYNIKASSFATLNTIITSTDLFDNNFADNIAEGKYTIVDRINYRTINLKKVYLINDLARNLGRYNMTSLKKLIKKIDKESDISRTKKVFGHMLAGGAFAFLFNGGPRDSIVAIISMFFLAICDKFLREKKLNGFFTNMVGGMIGTIVTLIFYKIGFIHDISVSIISALMLLAPGISFTNSIRDIIAGDFISGVSRGAEAATTGVALAAGSGMVLSIFLR